MEENERFEIVYFDNDTRWKIIDNKTKQEVGGIDDMIKLLNEQDKRIKELEEENNELKDYTENTANLIDKLTEDSVFASTQLAIEELKKLKENAWQSATDISQLIDYTELAKIIDNQIKELKGEK